MDNEFGRNDSLQLLYFIQGLGVDPSTQQNRFEITHRILIAGTDQSIARLPAQELLFNAIQQEIPLGQVRQIEPGRAYEIEIQINDQVSGNHWQLHDVDLQKVSDTAYLMRRTKNVDKFDSDDKHTLTFYDSQADGSFKESGVMVFTRKGADAAKAAEGCGCGEKAAE